MRQAKATYAYQHPLKYIKGKQCRTCGKPATCAVITVAIYPACEDCAKVGKRLGYDVIFPEREKVSA